MRPDTLKGRTVVEIYGIFFISEEGIPDAMPEAIELIFRESDSLVFTSATDWTLRVEKGTWPEVPTWCYPSESWTYREIDAIPGGPFGKLSEIVSRRNEHGELIGVDLGFEGAGHILIRSGEPFVVEFHREGDR
ncbi:hypothetical protein [Streptomyces sp. Rer75]|uniref:hypothetical protein n=1 Tax=Streptomyces sp. Rer75 TaxID=2750011 RepID=UPI0015CFB5C3|nr:hypothetical protein [Streptomyces sp. Rer75]QLH21677.1 hypothetical protein HYQ63_14460 [Streptomyces sp. Rer75]